MDGQGLSCVLQAAAVRDVAGARAHAARGALCGGAQLARRRRRRAAEGQPDTTLHKQFFTHEHLESAAFRRCSAADFRARIVLNSAEVLDLWGRGRR